MCLNDRLHSDIGLSPILDCGLIKLPIRARVNLPINMVVNLFPPKRTIIALGVCILNFEKGLYIFLGGTHNLIRLYKSNFYFIVLHGLSDEK